MRADDLELSSTILPFHSLNVGSRIALSVLLSVLKWIRTRSSPTIVLHNFCRISTTRILNEVVLHRFLATVYISAFQQKVISKFSAKIPTEGW